MGPPDSGRVSRVPPYLGSRQAASRFRVRGSHPLRPAFPDRSPIARRATRRSRNPREQALGFRLLRFRSPLLTQSRLMSSPAGTEMFHFPASRPRDLCVQPRVMGHDPHRIAPFGNPRITVCLPLPEAYRSLPRPSSPDGAKASIVRPYTLSRSAFGQNQKRPPLGLRCILPRNVHLPKIKNPLVDQKSNRWWRQPDSNRRHPACKAGALPTELCPQGGRDSRLRRLVRKGCDSLLPAPRRSPCHSLAGGRLLRKEVILLRLHPNHHPHL